LPPRVRDALLLTLTAAAGSADAVSFLGLGRVFTANMTGNLVLLGIAIGQFQLAASVRSVIALAGFAAGVLIGVRVTARTERPAVWPPSVTHALLVELGLLAAFLAGWELATDKPAALPLDILVALSAGAMGTQAAAARPLHVVGVTTVFLTGMLTSLVADLATVGPGRSQMLWVASLLSLVIGAAAGAAVFIAWRPGAPLVALVLVGIVLAAAGLVTRSGNSTRLMSPPKVRVD
jgi:uncharacterized membrane protein YoaK (UPF0700 family)